MASGRRFRLVLLLIPLLAGRAYGTPATDGVSLIVEPAWNGHYFPGRTTEIAIRLIAAQGGEFELVVTSPNTTTRYVGQLEPDRPELLRFPVRPSASEPIAIEVMRWSAPMVKREIRFTPSPSPLHAAAVEGAPSTSRTSLIQVSTNQLPNTYQGYETVGSLRLNFAAFSALSEAQLHALNSYLARCGKLELVNIDRETLRRIRGIGGCNGKAIRVAGEQVADQLADSVASLPSASELNRLIPKSGSPGLISNLGLLAVGYMGFLVLMERGIGNPRFLLIVPLLGSACLIWIWPLQRSEAKMVSWFELESRDTSARYSALLVIEPGGQGIHETVLSRRMGLPVRDDGGPIQVQIDARRPGVEVLKTRTHPFSRYLYGFTGSVHVAPVLALSTRGATPEVANKSEIQAPKGYLSWKGEVYVIPPLAPGGRWSPTPSSLLQTRSDLSRLLAARSSRSSSTLLIPYSPQDAGILGAGIKASGWLVVKSGVPVS